MNNKYALVDLEPNIDTTPGTAHGSSDIIFGWTPIEIPTGACSIKSIHAIIDGTDGSAGNTFDLQLYFARSINGVEPPTFGTENAVNTKPITLAYRRNLLGYVNLDLDGADNSDTLRAYSVIGSRSKTGNDNSTNAGEMYNIILQGDPTYASTKGYQTIWVAGYGTGAFNFGTEIHLNQSAQAASVAAVQITIDQGGGSTGVAASSFAVGDQLIGATGGPTMEVVSLDSTTLMTVKNISETIDDDEELVVRNPLKFRIGLEY